MNCLKCGKPLKNTASQKIGYGPTCMKIVNADKQIKILDVNIPPVKFKGNVVCARIMNEAVTNVPRRIIYHSPDGFEWGYSGCSGPADFALNILSIFIGGRLAFQHYQEFKTEFISNMPFDGGVILRKDIKNWLKLKGML